MNNMRISGLASGIDTDEMIKKLMQAQRIPLTKITQKKQLLEWKRDDYRTLNNKILEFRNAAFDMKLSSKYHARAASVSGTSVAATATANANEGVYKVEVEDLATSASITSGELTVPKGLTSKIGLSGTQQVGISRTAGTETFTETIELDENDTIGSMLAKINSKSSSTGVKASYDETQNRLFFVSSKTGDSEIKLEATSGDLAALGFGAQTEVSAQGQNAKIKLNDSETLEYASNSISLVGINMTLNAQGTTTVTVSADVNAVYDNIKNIVDKYNELIDTINKETSEKRYRDFAPLTDEQKKEMSEDEIKRWEEKARSGALANDQLLRSGLFNFRNALSDSISGLPADQLSSLAEIGISNSNVVGSTVTGSYLDNGKLYIDEAKLKKAIAEKPDEVYALFTADDGDAKSSAGDGIAVRLHEKATALFNQITERAGVANTPENDYQLGKSLLDIDDNYKKLTRRLEDLETRYYNQFTAMETYLNRMNAQSAWLAQQFGGGA